MLSRRKFLQLSSAGVACLAAGSAAAVGFEDTTSRIELSELAVAWPELPRDLQDYRIAFLSDIHLGPFLPYEWVEQAVAMVRQAQPDLVLLGGDYLNVPESLFSLALAKNRNSELATLSRHKMPAQAFSRLTDIMQALNPADKIYAVYGNHDRWLAPGICADSFGRSGIGLLINEPVRIRRGQAELLLFGADDFWTGIPRLPKISPPESREFRILLAHNPDFVADTLKADAFHFHLALCGHTHGGQIKLPGWGPLLYNIDHHQFAEGLAVIPRGYVFTSRGIGVVEIPFRFNCPPEVSVIGLKRA